MGLGVAYTPLIELSELIQAIDEAVEAGGMSGRVSGWVVPSNMMWTTIGFLYAVEWIAGNVPQEHGVICLDTLERLAKEYAAELGFDSGVTLDTLTVDGMNVSHFILGTVDYRIFGE